MTSWGRGHDAVPSRASTGWGGILVLAAACVEVVIPASVAPELRAIEARVDAARGELSQLREAGKVQARLRSIGQDEAARRQTLEQEAVRLVNRYAAFGAKGLVTALEMPPPRKGASATMKLNLQGQAPYDAVAQLVTQCDAPGTLLSIRQLDLSQDSVDGHLLRATVSLASSR